MKISHYENWSFYSNQFDAKVMRLLRSSGNTWNGCLQRTRAPATGVGSPSRVSRSTSGQPAVKTRKTITVSLSPYSKRNKTIALAKHYQNTQAMLLAWRRALSHMTTSVSASHRLPRCLIPLWCNTCTHQMISMHGVQCLQSHSTRTKSMYRNWHPQWNCWHFTLMIGQNIMKHHTETHPLHPIWLLKTY